MKSVIDFYTIPKDIDSEFHAGNPEKSSLFLQLVFSVVDGVNLSCVEYERKILEEGIISFTYTQTLPLLP